jgi:RimJ/RimL family protein N-acetyltransferase
VISIRDLQTGRNVRLTAVRDSDAGVIEGWFNDTRFLRYYDFVPALPLRRREVESFLDGFADSSEKYIFALRMIDSEEIIGILGFCQIIWSSGTASLFIGIGNSSCTGRGLGKEALRLLLDFGFNELNFYRLQLNVIAYNEAAIKLYESLGFIREGTYRRHVLRDGIRYDMYLYGLLKDEWKG